MRRVRLDQRRRVDGFRLTETPTHYGLLAREQGGIIKFVPFAEARRRLQAPGRG
jgi:hypothetical protein